MTSEQRRENRYLRRKEKRNKKAQPLCDKTFEDVFTFENMYDASKSCCTGVRWKSSTINFETTLLTQTETLQRHILDEKYYFAGFKHFKTMEHGKERDINALDIHDRAVQKCYCDQLMTEAYSRSYILDNSASLKNRGMDFTLKRLKTHLAQHYRKHGIEGGIYQFDFKGYFASIPHEQAKERLRKNISDVKLQEIGCQLIDDFQLMENVEHDYDNPRGVGLGSQVSQNIALDYASVLDHYIKDELGIKGYARYMDDGYVISESLEQLELIRKKVREIVNSIGLSINEKKNIITPFKGHSFHFIKMRVRLEPSGKIVMKLGRKSIKAIRRKLKIFRKWVDENKMSPEDAFISYQSWRSHALRCNSYRTLHAMDKYFITLFEKELSEYDKKFKCTFDAKWDYEIGWVYFESKKEYAAKMAELDETRYDRYMNGFVPLCNRWEWREKQKSKSAIAFALLRDVRNNTV